MLKQTIILSTALISSVFAVPAFAGEPTITIENYVGKINIVTEPGASLKVESQANAREVDIDRNGDDLAIDGGVTKPDGKGCKSYYGNVSWSWNDSDEKKSEFGGYKNLEDYPDITVTAPESVIVIVENAIPFGTIGNVSGADIVLGYCGRLSIGDIHGPANFRISGSGDLNAGDIDSLKVSVSGSGDFDFGDVNEADIKVSGSGNVDFGNAHNVTLKISGSGDVDMDDVANGLFIKSSGSGDVSAGDVGDELTIEGSGSSDVMLDYVSGRALIRMGGSGDVDIDEGDLDTLIIKASGGSDVHFGGTAVNADLSASGGADIYVKRVTGERDTHTSGGADIDIGN